MKSGMRSLAIILALGMLGCGPAGSDSDAGVPSGVPDNAIQVDADYYMVPIAESVGGCTAYRPFSPTRRVVAAIHYRTSDGRFVIDPSEADCD